MNFTQAVQSGFENYTTIRGRAARSEFWYWSLFCGLGSMILTGVDGFVFDEAVGARVVDNPLSMIFSLLTMIPSLTVTIRRLHDRGKSGWWLLLFLLPFVGYLILMVWFCRKGDRGYNAYGADPLAG